MTERQIRLLEKYAKYWEIGEMGEPGYDNDKPYILADWNKVPEYVESELKRKHYLDWSDEYITCDNGKFYRCRPDCYSWQPSYVWYGGEPVAWEDIVTDYYTLREYINSELVDDYNTALNSAYVTDTKLAHIGAIRLNDQEYQNGLHTGMSDDPKKIMEEWRKKGYSNLFFRIPMVSQFYIEFEIWTLTDEDDENI